ncbi:MAG: hypothetical protein U1F30_10665 [Steroidobacteraceae bacterium]
MLDWSRDDRRLLLLRELDADDARLYVVDVASGALTPLDAPGGRRPVRMRLPAARFTPAGDAVLYLRDDGEDGRVRLKLAPLDGATPRALSTPMPHDVEYFDVSADGRFLAYSWSDAGYGHLAVLDQRAHALVALPAELPAGAIGRLRFDRGGTRLALEASTATTPPEIDVIDLATGALARWAQAAAAGGTLAPAQRFRFRTWDRSGGRARELAAYLYAPAGPGPHPVLVLLHDGPGASSAPATTHGAVRGRRARHRRGGAQSARHRRRRRQGRTVAAQADGALREDMTRDSVRSSCGSARNRRSMRRGSRSWAAAAAARPGARGAGRLRRPPARRGRDRSAGRRAVARQRRRAAASGADRAPRR